MSIEKDGESPGEQALAVMERILVAQGALSLDELAEAFRQDAPELAEALLADRSDGGLTARLQGLIRGAEAFWQLADGRLAAVLRLLRRAVFLHRLGAGEAARNVIDLSPDLVALALPRSFRLPDGTEVRLSEPERDPQAADEGSIVGPPGWLAASDLRAGSLIAVRYDGSGVTLEPIAEDALDRDAGRAVSQALAVTLTALRERAGSGAATARVPEVHHLLVETMAAHPRSFATAVAPVTDLLADAGLETHAAWVGPRAEPWVAPPEQARRRRLEMLLNDADNCCKRSARRALDGWLAWMAGTTGSTSNPLDPNHALQLAEDVDHGPVAALLVEVAAVGRSLLSTRRLGAWAAALTDAHGGVVPNAGVAYLRAIGADAGGDALAAEAHLHDALTRTPDHPACLGLLAELTQDRGDAQRSVDLLRRTGRAPGDLAMLGVEAFLPDRKVGRNDPCPCGSGRKYKACCARGPLRLPLTQRGHWLLTKAQRFVLRTDPGSVRSMQQLFGMAEPGSSGEIPPMLWDLVLFPRGLRRYLDTRGPLLPADELECARAWPDQPIRLLQVVTHQPGVPGVPEVLQVLDVRTGETLQLSGPTLPVATPTGETFLGRPLPVGAQWLLTDVLLPVGQSGRQRALEMLEHDVQAFQILELLVDLQVAALRAEPAGSP